MGCHVAISSHLRDLISHDITRLPAFLSGDCQLRVLSWASASLSSPHVYHVKVICSGHFLPFLHHSSVPRLQERLDILTPLFNSDSLQQWEITLYALSHYYQSVKTQILVFHSFLLYLCFACLLLCSDTLFIYWYLVAHHLLKMLLTSLLYPNLIFSSFLSKTTCNPCFC